MANDEKDQAKRVEWVLQKVREEYGFVPLVSEVMSKRPDIYLPYSEMSSKLFFKPKHMDRQTAELAAIAAGSALGSDNCMNVHIPQALKLGVSEDAILEAMLIGSFMCLNRSNSIAFRCLRSATEETK
ncbi:MAG: carboxymuconolactone decarboxylase family protein [Methanomassiliicoccales archaeon]|nr:carboxymuconolactone decarboxylase family protein [Methanomassiliicoccales archaeon]